MNCKQGDLAIIVGVSRGPNGSGAEHIGKIVRCVRLITEVPTPAHYWVIEPQLGQFWGCADKNLRPIRDPGDDAVDETVVFAGKPEGVPA